MSELRTAIIGASGIGKNHARWFHQHGCHVCAFVGSGPASMFSTHELLEREFGFDGRGYYQVDTMLREIRPEVVCIACPPALHFPFAMECLKSGAHVLCEKPLVYDRALSADALLRQARSLMQTASENQLILSLQAQYATLADRLLELCRADRADVRAFEMVMETKNVKPGREFEALWIELSPHPLSVLGALFPKAIIDASSIDALAERHETTADFVIRSAAGRSIDATVTVRYNPESAVPLRQFHINGCAVTYSGRKNCEGQFRTYLQPAGGDEIELPDLVDTLIGRFVQACRGDGEPVVPALAALQTLNWMLQIQEYARRV